MAVGLQNNVSACEKIVRIPINIPQSARAPTSKRFKWETAMPMLRSDLQSVDIRKFAIASHSLTFKLAYN